MGKYEYTAYGRLQRVPGEHPIDPRAPLSIFRRYRERNILSENNSLNEAPRVGVNMPLYPGRAVVIHSLNRGIQLGSALGWIMAPIIVVGAKLFRKSVSAPMITKILKSCVVSSGAIGIGSIIFELNRMSEDKNCDVKAVDIKAYKLYNHNEQNLLDKRYYFGSLAGGTISVLLCSSPISVVFAMFTGGVVGTLYHYGHEFLHEVD